MRPPAPAALPAAQTGEVQGTGAPILPSDAPHFVLAPVATIVYGSLTSGADFAHLNVLWDKDYFLFLYVTSPV